MFKCNVKKGHLLLGILFLLQRSLKAVRGDTLPPCSANECSYDSLPPILGNGKASFAPQKTCYKDHERVNVTCTGDLRGPPYNLCTAGYWLYPFGPTCEDITLCNRTNVPKHGSIRPDKAFFDLYERIYYSCNDKYSLVGPSEAVCESGGVWNPWPVPTCKADCLAPVLENGSVSPDTPTLRNGEVITFECDKNFTKVGLSVTTCRDGHFDPPELPACYADCPRLSETFHNGVRTGDTAPFTYGDEVSYKCNSNSNLIGSTTIVCLGSIWSDREPVCKEYCWVNKVPNSDCASGYKLSHNETLRITCNIGYSTGVSQTTDLSCKDGILSPPELPECFAQCTRPSIRFSNATSLNPMLHHGDMITVTCDAGYSNGKSQSTTSVCNDGMLDPPVPFCYAKCDRPVIPNSDAVSPTTALHHGETLNVTCDAGFSNGQSQSSISVCNYGTFYPPVPLCYARCYRPVIPNSDVKSLHPFIEPGEYITITCDTGFSNGQSNTSTSICKDGIFHPALPLCYAQCHTPTIPNSNVSSTSTLIHHGEVITVTCDTGYSNGQSWSTSSICSEGIFVPTLLFCYAQCSRPVILNSDATSSEPVLHSGDVITVTCQDGYSNGESATTALMCDHGSIMPDIPSCNALCNRPIIQNSDATTSYPVLHHGEVITVTCNEGYSSGKAQTITSVCHQGKLNPPVSFCYDQCSRPVVPNSDATSSNPVLNHGNFIIVTCNSGYSNGRTQSSTSVCSYGALDPTVPFCQAQCNRPVIPNSDSTSPYPALNHGESLSVTCDTGYSNGQSGSMTSTCIDGSLNAMLPFCYAQCSQVIIPNSDASSLGPSLHNGDFITVTCNIGFSNGYFDSTTSVCSHGTFTPPLLQCYAQCSRPIIPNSDATSSSPPLHHGVLLIVTCNTGYSTWQSQTSTSTCTDGELKPDVPLCYAQCDRPVIPNSDSTSSVPVLHNGDKITVTCDDRYSNGKSKKTTSVCNHGRLDPAIPPCYAQCSRPVIPNSDVTSSNPVLSHGDIIIVKCNNGYSNGNSDSSSSVCNHGSFNPSVPFCYAECNRPVIANSDATFPYPLLDHGEALTITCDTGYSNGQSISMTTVCTDGILNLALPFCYAQCSRKVIPNSDSSSSAPIHHGEVLIVTCDEGYSGGQGIRTTSVCGNGIFSPPLPSCFADCKSLKNPNCGEVVIGSDPYSHREVAVFECYENYSLVGNQEIYCYDGLWDRDPPVCMAPCSRPVIPNSDAISPNPLVHHGNSIAVTCNMGYTNGETGRTTLICEDGTLFPDEPKCIGHKMEGQDVAGVVVGVLGTVIAIAAIIWIRYERNKWKRLSGVVQTLSYKQHINENPWP